MGPVDATEQRDTLKAYLSYMKPTSYSSPSAITTVLAEPYLTEFTYGSPYVRSNSSSQLGAISRVPGSSVAWDSRSKDILQVWRDIDLNVHLTVRNPDGSPHWFSSNINLNMKSTETPSIACARWDAFEFIDRNCILVMTEPSTDTVHYERLKWVQFKMSGHVPQFGPTNIQGINIYGPPEVATHTWSQVPFMLKYRDFSGITHTTAKASGETDPFQAGLDELHGDFTSSWALGVFKICSNCLRHNLIESRRTWP